VARRDDGRIPGSPPKPLAVAAGESPGPSPARCWNSPECLAFHGYIFWRKVHELHRLHSRFGCHYRSDPRVPRSSLEHGTTTGVALLLRQNIDPRQVGSAGGWEVTNEINVLIHRRSRCNYWRLC
jgi:hypothetical protein